MTEGHCLCGAVRWAYTDGAETWACYCHCADCRRNCAAPVTSFIGVPRAAFRWTGAAAATYASSPGVRRRFCPTCGTPMAFEADRYPDEIHLYAATLADPQGFRPRFHVHFAKRLEWLELADDLPRHEGFLPGANKVR